MEKSFAHIHERIDYSLITLKGVSFESEQISQINNEVSRLIERGKKNFIVDLSELKIMNSTVSSMLLISLKKARAAGGDLILANVPDLVARQLDIVKLTSVFTIARTTEQAQLKLKSKPGAE
ncbi:MAG TPA: STAS domain-containing protein [Chitinophagales bacterium]|nr:STAS domain-containing protein [Chitinophagales bacterium]